ncbi:MAG: hypothetical protein M0P12_04530 [Paludibacteraceae bacterium]|jgi:hypothetical protein|nr:hypothetical protein [Paludibacteraceae bacterium]MCK9615795.1 hypothetical protein [Candidatus Omnitrophota bacterium]
MNYYGFDINGVYQDNRDGTEYFGSVLEDTNPCLGYVLFLGFWKFEIKTVLGKAKEEGKFGRVDTTITEKSMSIFQYFFRILPYVLMIGLIYMQCFNYLRSYEVGLAKNLVTKNVWLQDGKGFHFTNPFVFVARLDTRPTRVGVHSSSKTANQKLVQFQPEHWESFVKIEGWRYYWWDNRLSFNIGYPDEYRGWRDVCRGYAYSTKKYPFFKIIEEY